MTEVTPYSPRKSGLLIFSCFTGTAGNPGIFFRHAGLLFDDLSGYHWVCGPDEPRKHVLGGADEKNTRLSEMQTGRRLCGCDRAGALRDDGSGPVRAGTASLYQKTAA